MFDGLFDNMPEEQNPIDVLNNFFNEQTPETKTQIGSLKKIRVLCNLRMQLLLLDGISQKTVNEKIEEVINYYLVLMYSYKRKSREEVKDGIKALYTQPGQEDEQLKGLGVK